MRKIAGFLAAALCVACNNEVIKSNQDEGQEKIKGSVSVIIKHEPVETKSLTDYTTALDEEKMVNQIAVFVFDTGSGVLNAYKELDSIDDDCTFSVTTGEKIVYVVVNGPDLSNVMNISQLEENVEDLSMSYLADDGFVMIGSEICDIEEDGLAEPVVIVKRLVSRVVLQKVTCSLPPQYGVMTVNCAYLGNANSIQSFSGEVSGMVNPDGYETESKEDPIGKDGVEGACADYMYRSVDTDIYVGDYDDTKYHMYCQPDGGECVTCLYLLTTIDGEQYYYRVPLYKGLEPNTTCSVEVEIVNLGSPFPPDGDFQKGEIVATVNISGWSAGENYAIEF